MKLRLSEQTFYIFKTILYIEMKVMLGNITIIPVKKVFLLLTIRVVKNLMIRGLMEGFDSIKEVFKKQANLQ